MINKYLKKLWISPKENLGEIYGKRLIEWRKESVCVRVEHPTRLDRAHALGYKAKQGYIIVRQRVPRGGKQRERFHGGRRSKHMRRKKVLVVNYQWIAEQRANREYTNCEVLNSYFVGKDKDHYFYEIIMLDRAHPVIQRDFPWLAHARGRVFRGLTSSAKKSRGLRHKGTGSEKARQH
jgi:large subunit ribosomal protein L15e